MISLTKQKEQELYLPRLGRMQRMFEAQPNRVFCLNDLATSRGGGQINLPYLKRLLEAKIIEEVPLIYKFGRYGARKTIRGWRLRKR